MTNKLGVKSVESPLTVEYVASQFYNFSCIDGIIYNKYEPSKFPNIVGLSSIPENRDFLIYLRKNIYQHFHITDERYVVFGYYGIKGG